MTEEPQIITNLASISKYTESTFKAPALMEAYQQPILLTTPSLKSSKKRSLLKSPLTQALPLKEIHY
jgi:hypothetical protein